MAEGRMLKKRISKSAKFANLPSDRGRLLYLLLIPYVDCEGRFEANSHIIKGNVCPYIKTMTLQSITKCLKTLHDAGLIILYNVSGEQYLQITRFEDFNKINKEREAVSHIPAPPKSCITPVGCKSESGLAPAQVKGNISLSKGNISKDKEEVPIFPKEIDNSEFHKAWQDWKQHRTEIKKKLTPTAINLQLKMLAERPTRAVTIIEKSIRNGWQGLFEDKENNNGKNNGTPHRKLDEAKIAEQIREI